MWPGDDTCDIPLTSVKDVRPQARCSGAIRACRDTPLLRRYTALIPRWCDCNNDADVYLLVPTRGGVLLLMQF